MDRTIKAARRLAGMGLMFPRPSKYKAKRTPCGRPECGEHASKKEARRCAELQLMERAGEIDGLEFQPRFAFEINKVKIGVYMADWRYNTWTQKSVVEDCKGMKTALYRWKKRMMLAFYGIQVRES